MQIQALSCSKMRISSAILDFSIAVRAGVFTVRPSKVSGGATRHYDLPENTAWERRCMTSYASARRINMKKLQLRWRQEALMVMRRVITRGETDCCFLSRSIFVAPPSDEKAEHGLLWELAEDCRTKYAVISACF